MTKILELPEGEFMLPGNRACAGCGIGIAPAAYHGGSRRPHGHDGAGELPDRARRHVPDRSVDVPWVNVAFPSTAAAASGIAAGLRATGRADGMTVLAMAGDGGTGDIGIQALSGAAERNEDFIYLCYDNEAYMNTGTQRASLTPRGARTTTTTGRQA